MVNYPYMLYWSALNYSGTHWYPAEEEALVQEWLDTLKQIEEAMAENQVEAELQGMV